MSDFPAAAGPGRGWWPRSARARLPARPGPAERGVGRRPSRLRPRRVPRAAPRPPTFHLQEPLAPPAAPHPGGASRGFPALRRLRALLPRRGRRGGRRRVMPPSCWAPTPPPGPAQPSCAGCRSAAPLPVPGASRGAAFSQPLPREAPRGGERRGRPAGGRVGLVVTGWTAAPWLPPWAAVRGLCAPGVGEGGRAPHTPPVTLCRLSPISRRFALLIQHWLGLFGLR